MWISLSVTDHFFKSSATIQHRLKIAPGSHILQFTLFASCRYFSPCQVIIWWPLFHLKVLSQLHRNMQKQTDITARKSALAARSTQMVTWCLVNNSFLHCKLITQTLACPWMHHPVKFYCFVGGFFKHCVLVTIVKQRGEQRINFCLTCFPATLKNKSIINVCIRGRGFCFVERLWAVNILPVGSISLPFPVARG